MTTRYEYYQELKALAREIREKYQLGDCRILPSTLRKILLEEGVDHIDLRPFKNVRGLYISDQNGASVAVNKSLPRDPKAFTLGHELKHHLLDSAAGPLHCDDMNTSEKIEIGAEVFAAELLFPEEMFENFMREMQITRGLCTPEDLVRIKLQTDTTLSYAGLCKRACYLQYAAPEIFDNVRWRDLERTILFRHSYSRHRT
jgi:Zn-dependent peptidase ImmA (M78 family)